MVLVKPKEFTLPWRRIGEVKLQLHPFLISVLDGVELSASRPGRFTPGVRVSGTRWSGGWVGPGVSVDPVAKRKSPIIACAGNWTSVGQAVT
jgi:hypothetical protein